MLYELPFLSFSVSAIYAVLRESFVTKGKGSDIRHSIRAFGESTNVILLGSKGICTKNLPSNG